jgi:hypothetical protein
VATVAIVFLVARKAENDFQVAVLLLAVLAYRRLLFNGQRIPDEERAKLLHDLSSTVSLVTDVVIGDALLVVVFR